MRVMPGRMSWSERMRDQLAVAADDPGIRRGAFGDAALRVDEPGLARALLARGLLGQHIRQQRDRFDVDALPADVGHGDDGDAVGGQLLETCRDRCCARSRPATDVVSVGRKRKIAPRHAAGDLQIDDAVAHAVAAHRFRAARPPAPPATSAARCAVRSSERSSRAIWRRSSIRRPPLTSQTS